MPDRLACFVINSLCGLRYRGDHSGLLRIRDVGQVQATKLASILGNNKRTAYGQAHGFASIRSVAEYQARVPVTDYEDYQPYLDRIAAGERRVLTAEDVLLLEPSSGSTSASKLIPYTKGLKDEFQEGLRPWLYDLYASYPGVKWGKSYWAVTPAVRREERTPGGVPIGFEDDRDYFGALERRLFDVIFAVPGDIGTADDSGRFYHRTSLALLRTKNLTLVSVWNPTFLTLLLEYMVDHADQLVADLAMRNRERAAEVSRLLGRRGLAGLWPRLRVVSCWADASARASAERLSQLFPHTAVQPKGLLATEGFISFPLTAAGGAVLSVKSHFFEFESVGDGAMRTADELTEGARYSVVLTTSGGLYRYRLGDLITVTGFHGKLPVITFLGKQDGVSDLFGEKLNELFVREVLAQWGGADGGFAMVAPETDRYVLYARIESGVENAAETLDTALRRSFHYDYCRTLGQLKPLRIFALTGSPEREYLEECVRRGQRLGDVKPAVLHRQCGWDTVFTGSYL